jgi:hypothetical protein
MGILAFDAWAFSGAGTSELVIADDAILRTAPFAFHHIVLVRRIGVHRALPDREEWVVVHAPSLAQQEAFMDTSLAYCRTSLQEVREKIRDIKTKLLPEDEERTLKRQLKRLRAVEDHLVIEVRRLEQMELFTGERE